MDLVLLKESASYISESGVFEQGWTGAKDTPVYKDDGDINDENNYRPISVISHIAKMVEALVSYQGIDFWKNAALFQWINLLIWKCIQHRLVFTVL